MPRAPRIYTPSVERLYEVEYDNDSGQPKLCVLPGHSFRIDNEHHGRLTVWHNRKPTIFHHDRWIRLSEVTPEPPATP